MLSTLTMIALSFAASSLIPPQVVEPLTGLEDILKTTATEAPATERVPPPTPQVVSKEKRFICKGCSPNEQKALSFLQDKGITDKNAIATILGNIRQESTFVPNICEGGARTNYSGCSSGGYGLIQWTDFARFNGLGSHARQIGGNPATLETQLSYLVSEPDWKMIEHKMKTPGKSIEAYMSFAQRWIRWGHHGARTNFAYGYQSRLTTEG